MRHRSLGFSVLAAVASLAAGPAVQAQAPAGQAPAAGAQPAATAPTGVPLDADYVIFVIDSSGSMRRFAWDRMVRQLGETLEAYGSLDGIQVVNDEGNHLLASSRGEWIPDTPANRQRILSDLADWEAFSNSNPGRGLLDAIDRYHDPDKKIAIHIYGDDIAPMSSNAEGLLRQIDQRNRGDDGAPRIRIHAVAFPVYWEQMGQLGTSGDYAALMRTLAERNGGSFIALPGDPAVPPAREPVTGLPASAARTLLLVDRGLAASAAEWRRVVAAVDRLTTDIGADRAFQIVAFDSTASSVVTGMDGRWIAGGDAAIRGSALEALGRLRAGDRPSLAAAFGAIGGYADRPDHVVLLADRLPTGDGAEGADSGEIETIRLLTAARDSLPPALPVSVLLFGDEPGTPLTQGYWALALATGGSLVAPGSDWP